jgi:xanthine dehydrogenase iron-sulfur cluster and FAD-binding subunit A
MWQKYFNAYDPQEVILILADQKEKARIIAGATDLILEMGRGLREGLETLIDISRVPGMNQITLDDDNVIHLGPLTTHNDCIESSLIREKALPLAQAAWQVGSPQIRNRGTVAGNLITASPANDTITPLFALGARLTLRSNNGLRVIPLENFYKGVRQTILNADEMLVDIAFPAMRSNQNGIFIKHALRRAQAISLVNLAIVLTMDDDIVQETVITLGAVAPTIIHALEAEQYLVGKKLTEENIRKASELAVSASRPIDDARSSAAYRQTMIKVWVGRGLQAISQRRDLMQLPENPVLLRTNQNLYKEMGQYLHEKPIQTTINGHSYEFKSGQNKTLLRLIREEGGLLGSKESCAEGECGACTILMDGMAVMGCLVPAPRAHGANIITVEGLAKDGKLHPIQKAFIDDGAVQCGYCTPGLLMSSAKLLEEKKQPMKEDILQAISGNLCRCTGYYKIIQAIEHAASAIE